MKMLKPRQCNVKKMTHTSKGRVSLHMKGKERNKVIILAEQLCPTFCPDLVSKEGSHQLSLQFLWRY